MENFKGVYFSHALKWICDVLGIDYYGKLEIHESSHLIDDWKWLNKLLGKKEEEEHLKPLPRVVLNQYIPYPHELFLEEGISIPTQKEFGISFDIYSERIIIPIFDELNTLVGVKGRRTNEESTNKYMYLYPCPKSKLLYGLNKTLPHILKQKEVIVAESEKGCLQLWSKGYRNCVAIGGKTLSSIQLEKLLRLNVDITLALDKGVTREEINKIIDNLKMFTQVYVVWDKENILEDKESPMDNIDKWRKLYAKRLKVVF